MSALGCDSGIAHLMGNLHATAQINLSCELHESGAQYSRFMGLNLPLPEVFVRLTACGFF